MADDLCHGCGEMYDVRHNHDDTGYCDLCAQGMVQDALRFQFLQDAPRTRAQAFFWNYSSRRERVKAIDKARTPHEESSSQ